MLDEDKSLNSGKDVNNKSLKEKKSHVFFKIIITLSVMIVMFCSFYLYSSFRLLKKYDVDKIKLGKYEIVTLNGVLKKNRKLVYASEGKVITLKYDITGMTLNHVYEYLGELSSEGYVVWNLSELYMRIVHPENDIQVRIKVGSNHLIFEYNIGIDKTEEIKIGEEQTDKLEENKTNDTEVKKDTEE